MTQEILLGKIPLLINDWNNFDHYKNSIIQTCILNEKPNIIESNVSPYAKKNLWESKFDFLESHKSLNELKLWLMSESEKLINTFNNSNYRIIITESWAHVTRNGGYHRPHCHNNSTWSGIFYISTSEESNTGNNNWYLPYYMERKAGLEFADDRFTSLFVPGRLILFPSMLLHDAEPYYGKDPRIVISFNSILI
jgi:uncharacterized protein (TIGR02466 family)